MSFTLRPYQQRCVDAALDWVRSSIEPCLIDAAPAAGKSFMIAALSKALHKMSKGKRVLALAPTSTLVSQNFEKFLLTGEPASIFSASAGRKETRHKIVFATPGTVKNSITRFSRDFCAVLVDEAHGMTPTIRAIIDAMRLENPNLRVIGLSGTPYNLGKGYIFRQWPDGRVNDDDQTRDPYFTKCVYRVTAKEMLSEGFITPMRIGAVQHQDQYDTSGIKMLPNGSFDATTVENAFVGHGRKTAAVVQSVVAQAQLKKYGGVMLFGATVEHAREILASLPPMNSAMVTGTESIMFGVACDEKSIIKAYREKKFRYLVSIGKLTTGFDVEHTSIIALLRYTDSPSLLQQILGRAWRLDPMKAESLLLDYAGVVDVHFPDGDIYSPVVRVGGGGGGHGLIQSECPDCGYENEFSLNPDCKDYQLDKYGYCLDVFGDQVMTPHGPMPAHYGRRCVGLVATGSKGQFERCSYYYTSKVCDQCGHKNDIASRFCKDCRHELVDPNTRLVLEFKQFKKDPTQVQCDAVIDVKFTRGMSTKGNETVRADWTTDSRKFATWHRPGAMDTRGMRDWHLFAESTAGGNEAPNTISYVKDADSTFYRILAFNKPVDVAPEGYEPPAPKANATPETPVCKSCGGPMSKYSVNTCRACYQAPVKAKVAA